mgnify:CR=1 FL=1
MVTDLYVHRMWLRGLFDIYNDPTRMGRIHDFVGGTFFGFGYGIYHVAHRPGPVGVGQQPVHRLGEIRLLCYQLDDLVARDARAFLDSQRIIAHSPDAINSA